VNRDRPTRDDILMRQAEVVSDRSTCTRALVGVVIAQQSRVVSQGYNGAPAGMDHCRHECDCGLMPNEDDEHANDCPASETSGCRISVHAEANAIAFAAKHGVSTNGASLYTTMSPCLACAQLIVNAGIVSVTYGSTYRYDEGLILLRSAGLAVSSWFGTGSVGSIKA
jgi:dCMP deaminase